MLHAKATLLFLSDRMMSIMSAICFIIIIISFSNVNAKDEPKLMSSETNVTVVVGRDATFSCKVENLQNYKVAWLRVDTQTILTIGPLVITKNHRVAAVRTDPQLWALTLRDVRPTDAGQYMCQINTEPMITQTHYLHVLVPPDIVDSSSSEVVVQEGDNMTVHCAASGSPQPTITWRREDSTPMRIEGKLVTKWNGEWLKVSAVSRDMNGALLCIATNGVPPSVSKRILLHVLCKPTSVAEQKMVGGYLGESVVLQCNVEANPVPVVIWTHIYGNTIQNELKYQATMKSNGYKHAAMLRVNNVSREDIGLYNCHVENSLGVARDDVTLYTLAATTTSTTTQDVTSAVEETSYAVNSSSTRQDDNDDSFAVVLSRHQMQNICRFKFVTRGESRDLANLVCREQGVYPLSDRGLCSMFCHFVNRCSYLYIFDNN